jgi:LPXTG-motif cell wall-anchored protein
MAATSGGRQHRGQRRGGPLRSARRIPAVVVIASLVWAGTGIPAARAEGLVPVPGSGAPGQLALSSSIYPLDFPYLAAGDSFSWQLAVTLHGEESGTSTLRIAATGNLAKAGGYRISVRECGTLWRGTNGKNSSLNCGQGARTIVAERSLSAIDPEAVLPLGSLREGTSPFLAVTLRRPAEERSLPAVPYLHLGIGVYAVGDEPAADPGRWLPFTGSTTALFVAAGIALVVAGAALASTRRRKDARKGAGA